MAEVSSGNTYHDFDLANGDKLRLFKKEVDPSELIWHRDKNPRRIYVEGSDGWMFQLDNENPVELKTGDIFNVPEMVYHRIIKGEGDLVLRIKEL